MNIKNKKLLTIFVPIVISIYLFLPVDFIWFIISSLIIGSIESVFFLVKLKKYKKVGILVSIVAISSLILYLKFTYLSYHYYHIIWNIIYFILTLTILFIPCYSLYFQKKSLKKKIGGFLLFFLIVGLKSFILDTKYYYTTTSSILIQDIRNLKYEGYYKVIGNHKLLRKNPSQLTAEDYEAILYLLNKTDWLEENFSDNFVRKEVLIDSEYIKHNSKYICSSIGLYNISKCDIYSLRIPLNKTKYTKLYIPKGSFIIHDETDIDRYYNKQPPRINNCYYKGTVLPPLTEDEFSDWTK